MCTSKAPHLVLIGIILLLFQPIIAQELTAGYSTEFLKAREYLSQEKWEKGEKILYRLMEENPDSAPILATIGRLNYAYDDMASAKRELKRALDIEPDNPIALLGMAEVLEEEGDFDGSYQFAEKAFFYNNELHLYEPIVRLKGALHIREGEYGEAEQLMTATLNTELSRPQFMNELAFVYLKQEREEKALEVLYDCLEKFGDDFLTLNNMGYVLNVMYNHNEAKSYLNRARKLATNDSSVHTNLAVSLYLAGDLISASQSIEKAIALDKSRFPLANVVKMRIYSDAGDCLAACRLYKRAMASDLDLSGQQYLMSDVEVDCGCK